MGEDAAEGQSRRHREASTFYTENFIKRDVFVRTLSGENSNTNNSMPKMSSCVFVHKEEICVKEPKRS